MAKSRKKKLSEPKPSEKTKVQAIQCPQCGDIMYSRARHDWRTCSCGTGESGDHVLGIFVDGGFNYLRFGWNEKVFPDGRPEPIEIEVDASPLEIYNDWNKRIDKLGRIKASSWTRIVKEEKKHG